MKRETRVLTGVFLVVCAAASIVAARNPSAPGTYYDEVIQAVPAAEFLSGAENPWWVPGRQTARLFGRPFPLMTQSYMGALKSQALIPFFALFGSTVPCLRAVTLFWGFLGLLFAVLWTRRVLGLPEALVAAALVACDPSFLFLARHDWGSFTLGLLCRCGGLYFVTRGWTARSLWSFLAAGGLLGLGIYNKIDFNVFLVAALLALALALPRAVLSGVRTRAAGVAAGLVGLLLGAGPMLGALGSALGTAQSFARQQSRQGGEWAEKLNVLTAMLDGSYFQRLMLAGGSFETLFEAPGAAAGPFPLLFALCVLVLGGVLLARGSRSGRDRAHAFVLLTTLLTMIGIFLTPNATRIHHTLNVYPFPHLVVAIVAVRLFRARSDTWRPALRVASVALVASAIAGSLYVDASTLRTIRETGGKGRWSDALDRFSSELASQPDAVVVSLDWGFHGQLLFRDPGLRLIEPIWRRGGWHLDGSETSIYLLHENDYAVFDYGAAFRAMLRQLPSDAAVIRRHEDREGDTAFLSVRFSRPHRLVYRGAFEILFPRDG